LCIRHREDDAQQRAADAVIIQVEEDSIELV